MNDTERLKAFLNEQKYMTLAVTLDDGTPWATPVRIKRWVGKEVEWDSMLDTEHSKAIAQRPTIAISIFTPEGDTTIQFGFYATATVKLLSQDNNMGRYRATVKDAWVNDKTFVKRSVNLDA